MQKLARFTEDRIVQSLSAFPVVYISGPRQSGKTTLAQHIASTRHKANYITFDDIQMVPELFRPLKIIVDENRKRKEGGRGQFLLTGSASVMALPKLSDALVGRMALHLLLPFSVQERIKNIILLIMYLKKIGSLNVCRKTIFWR